MASAATATCCWSPSSRSSAACFRSGRGWSSPPSARRRCFRARSRRPWRSPGRGFSIARRGDRSRRPGDQSLGEIQERVQVMSRQRAHLREVDMKRPRSVLAGVMATLAVIVSACGSSSAGTVNAQPRVGGTLTIDNESGGLWTCGFNPFNASVTGLTQGIIYEPLVYDNLLTDKKTPMLASSYQWSSDNKSITFTIRPGVKWSDGQPFSAADVVFTFNLIKQSSARDLRSVWSVLSNVTASGDQVTMTFQSSAVPYFYQIAGQVSIVPQHIWSTIKDPVGEPDSQPIGTGPFTVGQCTPQNI